MAYFCMINWTQMFEVTNLKISKNNGSLLWIELFLVILNSIGYASLSKGAQLTKNE